MFNNTSSLPLQNIPQEIPAKVNISINNNDQTINNKQTGLFRDQFFITGNLKSSIPITVDIKPTFDQVIIWVINGIAIAIIFWKIVKFFNERYNLKLNAETRSFEQKWEDSPLTFTQFLEKRKITSGTIAKNAILDISSIAFGIVIGLVALINDEFIAGVRLLDALTIIFLIGVGIGIGSLKEYIHQASEPNKPAAS